MVTPPELGRGIMYVLRVGSMFDFDESMTQRLTFGARTRTICPRIGSTAVSSTSVRVSEPEVGVSAARSSVILARTQTRRVHDHPRRRLDHVRERRNVAPHNAHAERAALRLDPLEVHWRVDRQRLERHADAAVRALFGLQATVLTSADRKHRQLTFFATSLYQWLWRPESVAAYRSTGSGMASPIGMSSRNLALRRLVMSKGGLSARAGVRTASTTHTAHTHAQLTATQSPSDTRAPRR